MSKTVTVKLSRPLTTHKGELMSLELKEPIARSFIEHGEPFKMTYVKGAMDIDYNSKICAAFLADMTGIDALILEALSANDFLRLRDSMVGLLMGNLGETPTEPLAV